MRGLEKNDAAFELKLSPPASPEGIFSLEIISSGKCLKDIEINRFAFCTHGATFGLSKEGDRIGRVCSYSFVNSHKLTPKYVSHSVGSGENIVGMRYVTHAFLKTIMDKKDYDLSQSTSVSLMLSFSGLIKGIDPDLRMMTNSIEVSADFVAEMIAVFRAKNIEPEDPFITYLKEQTTVLEKD